MFSEDEMTETITSKSNPRLKELRKLHDRKHRERSGLFLAEGEDMLAEALSTAACPRPSSSTRSTSSPAAAR